MNILSILGIIGGVASLISLGLAAIVFLRRRAPRRELVWHSVESIPVASITNPETDYQLSVVFQRPGQEERKVSGVYLTFLRLMNRGSDPFRSNDLVSADPLRIEVATEEVLDISLVSVVRDVAQFKVHPFERSGGLAISQLSFDFLDHGDGALMRILSAGPVESAKILGTIVGLPQGLTSLSMRYEPSRLRTFASWATGLTLFSAAVAGTIYAFLEFVAGWADLWILLLPLAALIVPLIVLAVIADSTLPGPTRVWPKELGFGVWDALAHRYAFFHLHRFDFDESEEDADGD